MLHAVRANAARSPGCASLRIAATAIAAAVLLAACGPPPGGDATVPSDVPATLQFVSSGPAPAQDAHDHDGHAHPTALKGEAPLPGASIYHLDASWTDHRGETLDLEELRGGPVIVTMIYASCETACPLLIRDAIRLYDALPAEARAATSVLVVSFDPERDAPGRLADYVAANDLERPSWRFAVGEAHDTRALAGLLGVRYRPAGNGMFSHSNLITVLGPDGVVLQQIEGLGRPLEPAIDAIVANGG
jgi:protein SCO1/2